MAGGLEGMKAKALIVGGLAGTAAAAFYVTVILPSQYKNTPMPSDVYKEGRPSSSKSMWKNMAPRAKKLDTDEDD
ncbi:hypothetical protein GUITHDRAFT_121732 [Guillardia theta CCMP2712]|uniref:Transmembrane protein n=1 Tax=Guillardia theta (strain CCMP2712) TaxID=905079 RepID=L1I898_GUITC|nr:hypothetical protein GUITHDRAFT_121732 [Guillardia theta CCMP2712]EKX32080.1 hypothetical protein GUITHDRAFT_121732 [Guillardia theta CCMP2712]|eukprot:XP_005819060.1 hypothetical protein GUITHDRAFT_121732 [Guillardia theta CCMP2712]